MFHRVWNSKWSKVLRFRQPTEFTECDTPACGNQDVVPFLLASAALSLLLTRLMLYRPPARCNALKRRQRGADNLVDKFAALSEYKDHVRDQSGS